MMIRCIFFLEKGGKDRNMRIKVYIFLGGNRIELKSGEWRWKLTNGRGLEQCWGAQFFLHKFGHRLHLLKAQKPKPF